MIASLLPHLTPRPIHGGNVHEIGKAYGISPDELLDFSSNINPVGPPPRVVSSLLELLKDASVLTCYPEPDCSSLARVIANHLDLDSECVTVANGTAALLDIVLREVRPKRCLVPIPAFSEYDRALRAARVDCAFFHVTPEDDFRLDVDPFIRKSDQRGCDFWILTNPHNPSGNALNRQHVLRLLEAARDRKVTVLLDEAFVDYAPEISVSRAVVNFHNLIVLRSLTKFYALAGLRAGFALASPLFAERLRLQVPSWPVSALAIAAGIEALSDPEYAEATLSSLRTERAWLSEALQALGLRVFPSSANFLLLGLPLAALSATSLKDRLIAQSKIVIRDCTSYPGLEDGRYFRIAVRDHEANIRLLEALKEALNS